MGETIEVDAKAINTEIETLTKAEKWLARASERVAERSELYKIPDVIENESQYATFKEARTSCRKDVEALEAERKAILRDFEDALAGFKKNVKDVISPLTSIDVQLKEKLDAYEAGRRTMRQIELCQEYEALAPKLVPLVPFDLILKKYGNEPKKGWLNRSTNIEAAKLMLSDALYDISEDEKSIDALLDPEEARQAKVRYFQTLDYDGTMRQARRDREQRERLERLEAERAMREAQPEPEPMPEPTPEPVVAQAEAPVRHWYIELTGDRAFAEQVADMLRNAGLRFDRICSDANWKLERR